MNAIYWNTDCPVYLKRSELAKIQGKNQKLIIIGDISCDICGSVQATLKYTTPDNPVFIFNAKTGKVTDGFIGEGFADMAVDNLPCEFSREASDYFSNALMPFMDKMLLNDYSKPVAESNLPEEIKKACIVHQGKLQPVYEYLEDFLKIQKESKYE
jgi:alpha-aminoadipic semialdehyde synthase